MSTVHCGDPTCPLCNDAVQLAAAFDAARPRPRHIPAALRGFRTWRVAYSQNSLTQERLGVLPGLHPKGTVAAPWVDGINEAECLYHGTHAVPCARCECGFYAWYQPQRVEPVYQPNTFGTDPEPDILGVIEGAGHIMRHNLGFRAEKARIIAVYARDPVQAEMIRATYPSAAVFEDRDAMLADYPPQAEEREGGVSIATYNTLGYPLRYSNSTASTRFFQGANAPTITYRSGGFTP